MIDEIIVEGGGFCPFGRSAMRCIHSASGQHENILVLAACAVRILSLKL